MPFRLEDPDPVTAWVMKLDMVFVCLAFKVVRYAMLILDTVLDFVIGWSFSGGYRQERISAGDNYANSAQVARILCRGALSLGIQHQPSNFCLLHEAYVHPRIVLEDDSITLQGVTPTQAFFCVARKDVDVYDTKLHPFIWIKQFVTAEKLVIMPLSSFHRLASEEAGNPTADGRRLTLINNTTRCGSTLLCQMAATVPGVRVLSEPWALNNAHTHYVMGRITEDQQADLIESIVKIQCRREREKSFDHIVLKLSGACASTVPLMAEAFPDATFVFNTRNLRGTMDSLMQLDKNISIISRSIEYFTGRVFEGVGTFPYNDPVWWARYIRHRQKYSVYMMGCLFNYYGQMADYRDHKRIYKVAILFEDLTADPDRECSRFFEALDISEKYLAKARTAFKDDSQRGAFGKRGQRPKIADKARRNLEEYAKELAGNFDLNFQTSTEDFRKLILDQ